KDLKGRPAVLLELELVSLLELVIGTRDQGYLTVGHQHRAR
ncbi:7870_t:CDS:1, partial [Entrophospora sp. SA101]